MERCQIHVVKGTWNKFKAFTQKTINKSHADDEQQTITIYDSTNINHHVFDQIETRFPKTCFTVLRTIYKKGRVIGTILTTYNPDARYI